MLEVMQEVANIKKYVKNFYLNEFNALIRLENMWLIQIYKEEDGNDCRWLVIQYKVLFFM
jgi:hypothetical protein